MVLYLDGISPGNPLAPVVTRKSVTWYFTFHEFEDVQISSEAFWTVIAIARTVRAMHLLSNVRQARVIAQSGNSDTASCVIFHPDISRAVTPPHWGYSHFF